MRCFNFSRSFIAITILLGVLSLGLFFSGCGDSDSEALKEGGGEEQTATSFAGDFVVNVMRPDGVTVACPIPRIRELPSVKIDIDGKEQEGPLLTAVLQQAGVTEFERLKITGSNGSMELTRDQVTDQTILDYAQRGTVKLADPQIPMGQWIKDINLIEVK